MVPVSAENTPVGFVGLGIMGKAMARNLLKAGYNLNVHNRSRPSVLEMVREGASDGESPLGVARASHVVITMLPTPADVERVVFGPNGLEDGFRERDILIDMSTVSPETSRDIAARLARRGVDTLDAPVSGGQHGAETATLAIMVGGAEDIFARCRPILEAMGSHVVHIGGWGAGQMAKICNQIIVGVTIQAVAEAITLARKSGIDPGRVRHALMGGFAQSRILEEHGKRMIESNYEPGGRVALHHKDLEFALAAGQIAGVPLPATALVHQLFTALLAAGRETFDHSALGLLAAELAGLPTCVGEHCTWSSVK